MDEEYDVEGSWSNFTVPWARIGIGVVLLGLAAVAIVFVLSGIGSLADTSEPTEQPVSGLSHAEQHCILLNLTASTLNLPAKDLKSCGEMLERVAEPGEFSMLPTPSPKFQSSP